MAQQLLRLAPQSMRTDRLFLAFAVVAAWLLGPTMSQAQATAVPDAPDALPPMPPPDRSMSLPEAIEYARAHQPAIRAALARINERMAEAKVPSAQWLPSVGVTAQLYGMSANNTTATYLSTFSVDVPRIGGTAPVTPSQANLAPYASTLVGAGLTQELLDFGRIGAQRAAADALIDVEKHQADVTRLDIGFNVEEAYFAVLAAKSIVQASDEAYDRSKVHRDLAKRGVDSGLRPPIELTRAEAELARFEVDRIRSRGGLEIAQAVLGAAIGAPDLRVDTASDAPTRSDMPSLNDALSAAQARDPALAAAMSDLKAAEARERAVGAELRPDVSLTATLTGRAGGAPPTGNGSVPGGDGFLPSVPNWDLGAVLSWPLFDGVIDARQDAARSVEQVRHDEIEVAREGTIAQVRRTFAQVEVSRSAIVALQNQVVAARANYDQADARFKAGIGNAVELADADAVRINADVQLAIGQFDLARDRAAFGRAIAEGL
jgi:outer membrane protein